MKAEMLQSTERQFANVEEEEVLTHALRTNFSVVQLIVKMQRRCCWMNV